MDHGAGMFNKAGYFVLVITGAVLTQRFMRAKWREGDTTRLGKI